MTAQQAFNIWHDEWEKQNRRDNGWYPTPSTIEAFYAGFEAAQKNTQAPNEQNSES